ncbi:unnamed protein product [Cylindrotheca closterium]|uniref:Uncharacterized protein n=1 Tax=Cylindrotheca closterium TaxID=2856 RepID=A0AAD2FMD3_9STRA|nr:unnamed protein product [Cylindrotheca closterium]
MINGRRTVLISGLLRQTFSTAKADGMESIAHSATKPTALAIPDSRMQSRKEPREGPKSQHNKKPRKRKSVATKHRIPGRYQTSNMEIKTQGHAAINSKAATYQAKPRQSHSKTKPVARRLRNASLQSSLGVSAPIRQQQQQQPQQRSIFVLLAFSCALVGGGMFGLRALKRLENWEIQSQEESLAYDFAFTTKRDSNYGSFEPQIWEGDLNKFDV